LRTYQTIVVIDSLLKSEEIDAIIEKVVRIINNNGGDVKNVDRWEKKRLAYQIKNRQYGYYVEIMFQATGDLVKILERDYRLDENILRYLTIVLDTKALNYLEKQKQKKEKTVVEVLPALDTTTEETDKKKDLELAPIENDESISASPVTDSDPKDDSSELT